ncbi:MAG: TPM domain-containing protein, partial [Nitrospirae bacterium]
MPGRRLRILIVLIVMVGAWHGLSRVWAILTIPDPGSYVVDTADIITASDERRVEAWLGELEHKTSAQVKVLTVPTTQGEDLFSFTHRHAELWKLGQRGKDNGALITLAVQERRVRIHTGYGLEDVLPDSWLGSLSRAIAKQYFQHGQYSQGLLHLTIATANKIADAYRVQLTGIPDIRYRHGQSDDQGPWLGASLIPLLILFAILSSVTRRRRFYSRWGGGLAEGLLLGGMLSGTRHRWGGYPSGFG